MKLYLTTACAAIFALSGAAFAQSPAPGADATGAANANVQLSQSECTNLWQQAGGISADSKLSEDQVSGYVTDFKAANPDGDSTIEQDEWLAACNKGLIRSSASTGASSGEAGSGNTPEEVHAPTNRMNKVVPDMKEEPSGN